MDRPNDGQHHVVKCLADTYRLVACITLCSFDLETSPDLILKSLDVNALGFLCVMNVLRSRFLELLALSGSPKIIGTIIKTTGIITSEPIVDESKVGTVVHVVVEEL